MTTRTWKVDQYPLKGMSDDLLRESYEAGEILHREATPDDPRTPVEAIIAQLRSLPDLVDGVSILARTDSGAIAGRAESQVLDLPENRHLMYGGISVLPDHRRQGLGRLLLERLVAVAEKFDRSLLMGQTRANVPSGEAFCRRIGAELGQVMHENRQDLTKLDRTLLKNWLEEGPQRAPGYSLVFVKGMSPPEFLPEAAEIMNVMNTAPRDDLQLEDMNITPELLAEQERISAAGGHERWAVYAREDATGKLVGFTDVSVSADVPDRVHIGGTGVRPEHRGHALGKWLKADLTQRILTELPDVRFIITANATTNDAMLGINNQLGFHSEAAVQAWQVPVEQVRKYLAG